MIIKESKLRCAYNSGAVIVRCVSLLNSTGCKSVSVGAIIKVAIHRYRNKKRKAHIDEREHKKRSLNLKGTYLALIISVRRKCRRFGNFFFKTKNNRVVLVTKKTELIGTNLPSFVARDLAEQKFFRAYKKILLAARYVL